MIEIIRNKILWLRPQYIFIFTLCLLGTASGLKCIECYDCPEIELVKDITHLYEVTCAEEFTHCVKKFRENGTVVRGCGKQYMCDKETPFRPWYTEVLCCQCDVCNKAPSTITSLHFLMTLILPICVYF